MAIVIELLRFRLYLLLRNIIWLSNKHAWLIIIGGTFPIIEVHPIIRIFNAGGEHFFLVRQWTFWIERIFFNVVYGCLRANLMVLKLVKNMMLLLFQRDVRVLPFKMLILRIDLIRIGEKPVDWLLLGYNLLILRSIRNTLYALHARPW
jgi:hypothetical protein